MIHECALCAWCIAYAWNLVVPVLACVCVCVKCNLNCGFFFFGLDEGEPPYIRIYMAIVISIC